MTGTFTWLLLPAAVPGPHPAEVQQAFRLLLQQALLLFLAYFQARQPYLSATFVGLWYTIVLFLSFCFFGSFFVEYQQQSIFYSKDSLFVLSLYLLVL